MVLVLCRRGNWKRPSGYFLSQKPRCFCTGSLQNAKAGAKAVANLDLDGGKPSAVRKADNECQ